MSQKLNWPAIKQTWFSNVRGDLLAGIVVALALIPETIAFSITTGVDPKVGLYGSFCIAVVIPFVGGRSGMISAVTGSMWPLGKAARSSGLRLWSGRVWTLPARPGREGGFLSNWFRPG